MLFNLKPKMKNRYLIILLIFMSCGKTVKKGEKGAVEIIETSEDSIVEQVVDNEEEEAATVEDNDVVFQTFEAILSSLKTKTLPVIETTNFDDFIEAEDFKNLDYKALSLEKIYPHFNEKGYNFRAISAYKLDISDQFYTLVVTIKKGNHEMESHLINYDFNESIINHQVVSYDEVAEGLSAIHSKITKNSITRNHYFYEEEEFEQDHFQLLEDGKIEGIASKNIIEIPNMPLMHFALHNLDLNFLNIKTNLIVSKPHPDNPDDIIIVLPEIVDEGQEYFELNTHLLIINSRSGDMMQTFFESSKTNQWTSDAIRLDQIEIDTAPYLVKEDVRAFGVVVHYFGSSRVNPYYNKTLSLFIKSDTSLKKVLHNFSIEKNTGEWNGVCEGEHESKKKTLIMSSEKTNDFFDITVKTNIVNTIDFEDEQGDCNSKDSLSTKTSILKFDGNRYLMD